MLQCQWEPFGVQNNQSDTDPCSVSQPISLLNLMDTMEEHISAPILKNRVKQEVLNEIDEENKFDNHYLKSFKSLSRSRVRNNGSSRELN